MNSEEIKKYVRQASKGSAEAFGALYEFYAEDLYRYALYNLKNPHEAQDAVQNAAVTAFTKIKTLKNAAAFKSWFFKILLNECRKIFRNRKELPCEDLSYVKETSDPAGKTEISELMSSLPEPSRTLVQLSVFENCTSKEIAEILDMKASTVRSTLARSLKKLREAYNEVSE